MNSPLIKSELAKMALRHVPALIRNDLLADPSFLEEYGFGDATVLSFDEFGVSLKRSDLFKAVRIAMSNSNVAAEVVDLDGQIWQVKNVNSAGELLKLEVSRDDRGFILPDLAAPSPNAKIRLHYLAPTTHIARRGTNPRGEWREKNPLPPLRDPARELRVVQ